MGFPLHEDSLALHKAPLYTILSEHVPHPGQPAVTVTHK